MLTERTQHIRALKDAISSFFSPSLMQRTQRTSRQSIVPRHLFCELQVGEVSATFKSGLSSPPFCSASTTQAESYIGDTSWCGQLRAERRTRQEWLEPSFNELHSNVTHLESYFRKPFSPIIATVTVHFPLN